MSFSRKKANEVWNKIFYPPCYGLLFDGRTEKCSLCEHMDSCVNKWRNLWWRTIRWLKRIEREIEK